MSVVREARGVDSRWGRWMVFLAAESFSYLHILFLFLYVGELVLYVPLLTVECVICSMYVGGM